MGQESGYGLVEFLLWVSQNCSQGICWAESSSGGLIGEESIAKLIPVVGRVHFLAVVGWRDKASYWLSTEDSSVPTGCWQVLAMGLLNTATYVIIPPRKAPVWRQCRAFYGTVMGKPSHHLHTLLDGSKCSPTHLHSRGGH